MLNDREFYYVERGIHRIESDRTRDRYTKDLARSFVEETDKSGKTFSMKSVVEILKMTNKEKRSY